MKVPRIMIAAIASGSGKTTITCGILQALLNQGLHPVSSKCGPDYIDPMFHAAVLGIPANNLDVFLCGEAIVKGLFVNHVENSDIAIIEGVMGFYDGQKMDSVIGSSYDIARITKTPVILIVSCQGMGLSVIPLIKGMMDYKEDSGIKGIILNGISEMLYETYKTMIESQLFVKVIGYVPQLVDAQLESRHLGLVTPQEIEGIQQQLQKLGQIMEKSIDMKALLHVAKDAEELEVTEWNELVAPIYEKQSEQQKLRIGVAYDSAFCFYYKDNLELLKKLGCELIYFSPLKEEKIPDNIQGLLLGGGYPELYVTELSANIKMKSSIKDALEKKLPCLAECGGFMYLHEEMEGQDGIFYPMVGVIAGNIFRTDQLVRFGYVSLHAKHDNLYQKKGALLKGHEFHYWNSTNNGKDYLAMNSSGKKGGDCMLVRDTLFAGYPHIHFYSNLEFAKRFVTLCKGEEVR